MTQYLIYKNNIWELATLGVAKKFIRKNGISKTIEIKSDEMFVIFNKGKMQLFTAEKEIKVLDLKGNEDKYEFGGRIVGKYESDIFVYKRK